MIPAPRERCGSGEIEIRRDAQNEMLIDDDAIGIATISDAAEILSGELSVRVIFDKIPSPSGDSGRCSRSRPSSRPRQDPRFILVTARPFLVTRPTISWPGTHG